MAVFLVVAGGLFCSSVVGWSYYAVQRKAALDLQAKLLAYERQHQQDVERIRQYVKRLDIAYEATRGYVPTDFDPDTKA